MFRNAFQSGFLTILFGGGSNPLSIWDKKVENGHLKRTTDEEVKAIVIEIIGNNVATAYIYCPSNPKLSLGIKLPFLIMIIKNLKRYFSFEVQILDDKNQKRRFRVSNFQSASKVRPFCCTIPLSLNEGWNQVQFNLADITRRAYGTNYIEAVRMQVHANCRVRRIYFADRLYTDDELPADFKLFMPAVERKPMHCRN